MNPRLCEDDGFNVMPAPCAPFLLFRVIPALNLSFLRRQESIPKFPLSRG